MELQFMLLAAKPVRQSRYKVLIANCPKIHTVFCYKYSPTSSQLVKIFSDGLFHFTYRSVRYIHIYEKFTPKKRVRIKAIFHGKHWCMKLNKIEILLQKYFHCVFYAWQELDNFLSSWSGPLSWKKLYSYSYCTSIWNFKYQTKKMTLPFWNSKF